MPEIEHLSPEVLGFIERNGTYFEQYGLPRIGGRITGLLLVAHRPLSLDDIAEALQVSRASVSTNVRLLLTYGFAERVSLLGDRRDYYRFPEHGWDRILLINIEAVKAWRAITERGLAAVSQADSLIHDRLEELLDFINVVLEDSYAMREHWQARRQERQQRRA
jgi:DNA-binding transcriptional regulator GbsR (MarR family)